jgi:hypothetical protein
MPTKSPLPQSKALLRAIEAALGPNRRPLLIAIDGADGVGKSSLASWLAWQLEMPAVSLDLFLIPKRNPIEWRTDDFACVIHSRLDQQRPVIVEGVRVLDALDAIGKTVDYLIFIRGTGSHSLSEQLADYRARQKPECRAHFTLDGFDV